MLDKLIQLITQFIRVFQFFDIVRVYQKGVILRFGKFHRIANPGLIWFIPFHVEEVILYDVVVETMKVGPQSLVTRDGKQIVVSVIVTFSIEDIKPFLLEVMGGARVIEDSTFGVVSDYITSLTWEEIHSNDISNELAKKVRAMAKKYGVAIVRVQLADLSPLRSIRLLQSITNSYAESKEV